MASVKMSFSRLKVIKNYKKNYIGLKKFKRCSYAGYRAQHSFKMDVKKTYQWICKARGQEEIF